MTKQQQQEINRICENEFTRAMDDYKNTDNVEVARLRSCTAWVHETDNYYILQSYGTLIACINKTTDTLFDVLRTEYGYTATSAQHISKFEKDYGQDKWGCHNRYTAR